MIHELTEEHIIRKYLNNIKYTLNLTGNIRGHEDMVWTKVNV